MKETLTPDQFLELFLAGRTEEIEGREVRGNVVLYGATIEHALRALDVTFWGEVDFSECRFERSLDLSGCSFAKTVTLRNTHVGGTLDLSEVTIRTQPSAARSHLRETISIDLRGLRVENDLLMKGLTVQYGNDPGSAKENGSLMASGMRIRGQCDMTGLKTDGYVDISGGQFDGDVTIQSVSSDVTYDERALIGRDLVANNCYFGGNLAFSGAFIQGNVQLWSSTVAGILFVRPTFQLKENRWQPKHFTQFGADMNMAAADIGYFDAEALKVRGVLNIFAAKFNQFRLTYNLTTQPCLFGQVLIAGCTVENNLDLVGVHVTGDHHKAHSRGLEIRDTTVGGSLRFWQTSGLLDSEAVSRIDPERGPETLTSLVHGDLQIVGCKIDGELDLTNVSVTGRIILDDSTVRRDLSLRSFASTTHELRRGGADISGPDVASLLGTYAQAMSMSNLSCANDVDLTGLSLADKPDDPAPDLETLDTPAVGFLDARGSIIAKSLRLFAPMPESHCKPGEICPGNFARIPGAVNLTSAKLGELVLSFKSFDPPQGNPVGAANDIGLVLVNAQINEFSLPRRVVDKGWLRIPRPIDMRDVSVGQWNIYDAHLAETSGLSRRRAYESLVNADDGFRRSTYLAIESALRNRGHSEDADHIYRRMMYRDASVRNSDALERVRRKPLQSGLIESIKYPFRMLRVFLFSGLLGFGTQPLRLLLVILGFWLAMLPVFNAPANFEPSLAMLGAEATRYADVSAPLAESKPPSWSTSAAIATSLQFHLPVIALVLRDEWSLRETGPTCYRLARWLTEVQSQSSALAKLIPNRSSEFPECAGWSIPTTPEDTGILIAILNWIAWPFVLAFAINRFLRVDRS